MSFKKSLLAASLLAASVSANAVVINPSTDGAPGVNDLQNILNGITTGGTSSVDVQNDQLADAVDSYWSLDSSGGSVSTFVFEIAGNASINTFGIYDKNNPTSYVQLFGGTAAPGVFLNNQVTVSIAFDGSVILNNVTDTGVDFGGNAFGYYLGNEAGAAGPAGNDPLFFSDSNLNSGLADMMVAYQGQGDQITIPGFLAGTWGSNEYLLAFEDVLGGDGDYNDLVVMVESVRPVSEPATLALLGLGLAGLGFARRKQAKA